MNTTATAPVPSTATLRWQPPYGGQTAALRAVGLKTQDLRDAGFVWARSQAWEAPYSARAQQIVDALNGGAPVPPAAELAHDEAAVITEEKPAAVVQGQDDARNVATVHRMVTRWAKRLEKLEAPRDSHTPKKMAYFMSCRQEAAHLRRATELAVLWMSAPWERVPTEAQFLDAAAQTMRPVSNGYHGYQVETGEQRPTSCAMATSLRMMLQAAGGPKARGVDVEVMEAQTKFANLPGFFPTPEDLVQQMVDAADLCAGDVVLEPSAGKGDIAVAVKCHGADVECVEVVPQLAEILKAKGLRTTCTDFLQMPAHPGFDAVLMNPPFERGADIDHVRHAWGFVKEGGKLVAIVSAGALNRSDRKATEFRAWLEEVGAEISDNGQAFEKAFKRTGVQTSLVVITKAEG